MSKAKNLFNNNLFKISVFIIFAVFSSYTVSYGASFLRTIPFVFILPALSTLFYNRKLLSAFLCFVSCAIFLTVESTDVFGTIIFSLAAFLFAGLGILVKRFFVTAYVNEKKRIFCAVLGFVLLFAGIISYALVFGNPVSFAVNRARNVQYIEETYGKEAFRSENYTRFDAKTKRYYTNVSFTDISQMNADISFGEEVYDGYSNYYEYKYLSERREELASLFAENVKGECAVRINTSETETAADTLLNQDMVFDVAFYSQLTEKEDFAATCEKYLNALVQHGFECKKINFYGGFADEFLFKFSAQYPFMYGEDMKNDIVPFEEAAFDRYYNELDYADGWGYGK